MKQFCPILIFLFLASVFTQVSFAREASVRVLPVSPDDGAGDDVSWSLDAGENGLASVVSIAFDPPEAAPDMPGEPAWEYRIETGNGMILTRGTRTASEKKVREEIPLGQMENGDHTLVLLVRDFKGNSHILKRGISLDGRPKIGIISEESQGGVLNPEVQLSFFGARDGFSGMVNIRLDDAPVGSTDIDAEKNEVPVSLSALAGKEIFLADMRPGNHLLTIEAVGVNGSTATLNHPVRVNPVLPEIRIQKTDDDLFDRITIKFPETANALTGRAEVRYGGSVIFSGNAKGPDMIITREDLVRAAETHHLDFKDKPAAMILAVETAGGVENWQTFQYQ